MSTVLDKLKMAGLDLDSSRETQNDYVARCVFHQEKTPSLFINKEDGRFHCFGCKAGGGIEKLLEQLGCEITREEVDNYRLESYLATKSDKRLTPPSSLILEPIDFSWRGHSAEFLTSCGFYKWKQVIERGLQIDFVDRLWIPIRMRGIQVGYTAPSVVKGLRPTHSENLQSKEILLGYDSVTPGCELIICEGPADWLRLHSLGFMAVALLGTTSWSKYKLSLIIAKAPQQVILMMDGDQAGRKAADLIKRDIDPILDCTVCELPEGRDPDNAFLYDPAEPFTDENTDPNFWNFLVDVVNDIRNGSTQECTA